MLSALDSTTTLEVKRLVLDRLKQYRRRTDKNWSDTFARILNMLEGGSGDFYFRFITVDGFVADSADHDIIFQVGGGPDEPPETARYYRFRAGKIETMENLPKLKVEVGSR